MTMFQPSFTPCLIIEDSRALLIWHAKGKPHTHALNSPQELEAILSPLLIKSLRLYIDMPLGTFKSVSFPKLFFWEFRQALHHQPFLQKSQNMSAGAYILPNPHTPKTVVLNLFQVPYHKDLMPWLRQLTTPGIQLQTIEPLAFTLTHSLLKNLKDTQTPFYWLSQTPGGFTRHIYGDQGGILFVRYTPEPKTSAALFQDLDATLKFIQGDFGAPLNSLTFIETLSTFSIKEMFEQRGFTPHTWRPKNNPNTHLPLDLLCDLIPWSAQKLRWCYAELWVAEIETLHKKERTNRIFQTALGIISLLCLYLGSQCLLSCHSIEKINRSIRETSEHFEQLPLTLRTLTPLQVEHALLKSLYPYHPLSTFKTLEEVLPFVGFLEEIQCLSAKCL